MDEKEDRVRQVFESVLWKIRTISIPVRTQCNRFEDNPNSEATRIDFATVKRLHAVGHCTAYRITAAKCTNIGWHSVHTQCTKYVAISLWTHRGVSMNLLIHNSDTCLQVGQIESKLVGNMEYGTSFEGIEYS